MISRRHIWAGAIAAAAAGVIPKTLQAQGRWPTRYVTIQIGNAAGGDDDTLTRVLADTVSADIGQPVIVDNRPGGSTTVAGASVARAEPDGHTLLCLITPGVIQTVLRQDLPYSLDSFAPIIKIGSYPLALIVSAKAGIRSLDDIRAAASSDDGITFASGGVGTVGHLTSTLFLNEMRGKGVHVSFKNNPEGLQALGGGFVQMIFASAREGAGLKNDPNFRVLAVTAPTRVSALPDVPTTAEIGYPNLDFRVWYSYVAPAGVDPEIINRLSNSISKGVSDARFQERFAPLSFQTEILTGEEFSRFLRSEADRFRRIIVANDIRLGG